MCESWPVDRVGLGVERAACGSARMVGVVAGPSEGEQGEAQDGYVASTAGPREALPDALSEVGRAGMVHPGPAVAPRPCEVGGAGTLRPGPAVAPRPCEVARGDGAWRAHLSPARHGAVSPLPEGPEEPTVAESAHAEVTGLAAGLEGRGAGKGAVRQRKPVSSPLGDEEARALEERRRATDVERAAEIRATMESDRRLAEEKIRALWVDVQTEIFRIWEEVLLRRQKVMSDLFDKWCKILVE